MSVINKSVSQTLLLLIMILGPIVLTVKAQNKSGILNEFTYRIEYFTNDDGLPQNSIKGMAYDKAGNLWIGTEGGVACYNGQKIKTDFNTSTFKRIAQVMRSSAGEVFILDGNGEVFRAKENSLSIDKMDLGSNDPQATFYHSIYENTNLTILNNIFRSPTHFKRLYFLKNGSILQLGDKNEVKLFSESTTILSISPDPKKVIDLNGYALIFDKNHMYQLHGFNLKLIKPNQITGDLPTRVSMATLYEGFYFNNSDKTYCLLQGTLYELSQNGINIHFSKIYTGLPRIDGINSAVFTPESGILIVGSHTNGMAVIRPSPFKSIVARNSANIPDGKTISNNIISQILETDSSILATNGLVYSRDGYKSADLPDLFPYHVFRDSKKNFWYSINQEYTLVRTNPDGQVSWSHRFPYYVFDILENSDGSYLLAESNNLYLLDVQDSLTLLNSFRKEDRIDINKVFDFSDSLYWVATNKGLYSLHKQTHELKILPGLVKVYIRSITITNDKYIWIGTYGDGYYLYMNDRFYKMPLDRNQSLLFTHHFQLDLNGFLWIPTNNGLFQVLQSDLIAYAMGNNPRVYFHCYDKSFGFRTNEFNGGGSNPGIMTQDRMLSLASLDGLVWFYPEKVKPKLPDKPLYITSFVVDSIVLDSIPEQILLPANFLRMTIEVSTPFFGNPMNLSIEYRLIGQDTTWRPLDSDNTIHFDNLRHGRYTLQIRKQNGFGENNYTYLNQNIRVKPAFYNTSWFFLLSAAIIIFLSFQVLQRMAKQHQRQKDNLEKNIKERTENLAVTVEELKKSSQQNEMLLGILVHDVKAPLSFTHDLLKNLDSYWEEIQEDEKRMYIAELSKSTLKLSVFMQEFLTWMTLQQRVNIFAGKTLVLLKNVLNNAVNFMETTGSNNDNRITVDMSSNLSLKTNSQLLEIVVRNILENACKYTEKGHISIVASQQDHTICISFQDTGKGMSQEEIETLLKQKNVEANFSSSFKMGYQAILNILESLGGSIKISSKVGQGTKVNIYLPVA